MSKLVIPDDVIVPPEALYPPQSDPGNGEFEFADNDNDTFRGLASAMRFVGVVSIIFGVLDVIGGLLAGINLRGLLTIGQGVLLVLIGSWLATAATSLADISKTQGNDVMNLMYAMRKLKSVFTLQAWLMGIACVLLIASLVLALK
jgi:hypothetical protein